MADSRPGNNKLFFPNLDGLRFVCFLLVFLYHCNETIFKKISNDQTKKILHFIFQNGNAGVNIFFVLSGFLITILLIREREVKQTISLKNFYIRRVLRIWPLFGLCILLGFVVFPLYKYHTLTGSHETSNLLYYCFFANNFDLIRIWPQLPDALMLVVLWSVAVEEQFYLSWPVLIKYLTPKVFPALFISIIAGTLLFRSFYSSHTDADYAVRYFHTFSVIGDMSLGGLLAFYCSRDSPVLRYIQKMPRWQILLLYALTITVVLYKKTIFYIPPAITAERLVLAILFALIIAEQNYAEKSFFKFAKFRVMSKLGIYTYGLYCLQFVGILAVQQVGDKFGIAMNTLVRAAAAAGVALLVTIVISILSYHLYEQWFLRLKDRFAVITKQ